VESTAGHSSVESRRQNTLRQLPAGHRKSLTSRISVPSWAPLFHRGSVQGQSHNSGTLKSSCPHPNSRLQGCEQWITVLFGRSTFTSPASIRSMHIMCICIRATGIVAKKAQQRNTLQRLAQDGTRILESVPSLRQGMKRKSAGASAGSV
jgi:hypothetical protein